MKPLQTLLSYLSRQCGILVNSNPSLSDIGTQPMGSELQLADLLVMESGMYVFQNPPFFDECLRPSIRSKAPCRPGDMNFW